MRPWAFFAILATLAVFVTVERSASAMPTSPIAVAVLTANIASDDAQDEEPALDDAAEDSETSAVVPELESTSTSESSCRLPLECRRFKAISFSASDLFGHSLQLQHVRLQV